MLEDRTKSATFLATRLPMLKQGASRRLNTTAAGAEIENTSGFDVPKALDVMRDPWYDEHRHREPSDHMERMESVQVSVRRARSAPGAGWLGSPAGLRRPRDWVPLLCYVRRDV